MNSIEVSLDDIIFANKNVKNKKSGAKKGKFGGISHQNGRGKFQNGRQPANKKFGGSAGGNAQRKSKPSTAFQKEKIVRINLSNMAASVSTNDIQELFAEYNVESATVHYNQNGESLRTGDVVLPMKDAINAMKQFEGIAIDGEIIEMILLDGSLINSGRVQFPERQITRGGGGVQKRGGKRGGFGNVPNTVRGTSAKSRKSGMKREMKPKKTIEELDAELEEYMSLA